jgi:septin family protein
LKSSPSKREATDILQIMAEMQHNQIRSYPFDADENDDEELLLNERIRVS